MKTIITVIAILTLAVTPAADAAEPDIREFDPGSYVTGPKFKGKHLKNKVIVLEYWGITCPPCIKAIPHTTELAKKYGHDKLVVIANQSWNASDRQVKDVWEKHAKNDMVMVVNGGEIPDFKPNGVPHALIFDHELNLIWRGHPGSMDQPLAKAIEKLPGDDDDKSAEARGGRPLAFPHAGAVMPNPTGLLNRLVD